MDPARIHTTDDASLTSSVEARRVLIVEDNRDAADTLAMLLEALGYQVAVAYDGASGVRLAQQERPDIVLCDIGLPYGFDGYAVATSLRTVTPDAYLVALTGYAQVDDKHRALAAGFALHLAKPVDIEQLEAILASPRTSGANR